eukprot:Blabericola_migrator_1__2804@NODE_1800_length_3776_cov_766_242114_g1159_i0_p3_GENE_NODE_1800_length_3776_cov_766_242114_g1159_i0NODE_1800_length_3776_cov_766_242114_g1159_i0_p3_ORF_typecomplete_len161_score29_63_NODE_1800_length_3776_cov_766_242114_g1159_i029133395
MCVHGWWHDVMYTPVRSFRRSVHAHFTEEAWSDTEAYSQEIEASPDPYFSSDSQDSPKWASLDQSVLVVHIGCLKQHIQKTLTALAGQRRLRKVRLDVDPASYSEADQMTLDEALSDTLTKLASSLWPDTSVSGYHHFMRQANERRSVQDAEFGYEVRCR